MSEEKKEKLTFVYDLHLHSNIYSPCSELAPEAIVDRAIELGLTGIAITDHNKIWSDSEIKQLQDYAGDRLVILNGQEAKTDDFSDFIVFGLDHDIDAFIPVQEVLTILLDNGLPVIGAHPFRNGMSFTEEQLETLPFTAIEVFNNYGDPSAHTKLMQICSKHEINTFGGSDAHCLIHVGRYLTQFNRKITTTEELVNELNNGLYSAIKLEQATL